MIKIPIHSFINVITNSSTEIYIMATEKTIETIKEIVNSLLSIGGSELTCDDLFVVELNYPDIEDWLWDYDNSMEKAIDAYTSRDTYDCYVKVTAKDSKHVTAAKLLSSLHNLFEIDEAYN